MRLVLWSRSNSGWRSRLAAERCASVRLEQCRRHLELPAARRRVQRRRLRAPEPRLLHADPQRLLPILKKYELSSSKPVAEMISSMGKKMKNWQKNSAEMYLRR